MLARVLWLPTSRVRAKCRGHVIRPLSDFLCLIIVITVQGSDNFLKFL